MGILIGNMRIHRHIPETIRSWLRPFYRRFHAWLPVPLPPPTKHEEALGYWRWRWLSESGRFGDPPYKTPYKRLMLGMSGEKTDAFLHNKIVGDFGCGPRCSLLWAESASVRVGIDVLAQRFAAEFPKDITSQSMVYVACTESVIPICSNFFDVLFTLNAMDHVDNFKVMCGEILRVIKPGGLFIGSFNLEEPPTIKEPQRLSEDDVHTHLLNSMQVERYKVAPPGPDDDNYKWHFSDGPEYVKGTHGYLWVRARKKFAT